MKKLLTCTLAVLLATMAISLAAPDRDTLMKKEKAAWQAFKDKKPDDFKKVVSENMAAVYAEGISDMAKELADMQKWEMKSFKISDFKVSSDEPDTAMSTYKVVVKGTYGGKDASATYYAGSVWKKHSGEWKAIFHTDVKAAPGS
jgi:hypothetical protein